jgi:hypothetical protein
MMLMVPSGETQSQACVRGGDSRQATPVGLLRQPLRMGQNCTSVGAGQLRFFRLHRRHHPRVALGVVSVWNAEVRCRRGL